MDLGEQSVASAVADARRTATSEKSLGSQNGNRREITAEAKKVFRRLIGESGTVSKFQATCGFSSPRNQN